ncbi:ABC transporter substrate-binding protein [Corallincola luteus]|uniref:ABC transporter substrate-binding protein n=1 Tax=Corallincola luteus TaxID=1775177 RepID=A0ABY2AQP4_9GAMM|nr:ABC transporter substrate-binding protein [Corallincola luteus]TCI05505.1 ABC transporter substrate-binding protein [Corallincola luteus]
MKFQGRSTFALHNRYISTIALLLVMVVLEFCASKSAAAADIGLSSDPTAELVNGELRPGSHVKLFLPNLPYLAISHAVNAALLRPENNERGWQYDLAISHTSHDDKVWDFELRKDAVFHDGRAFNADSVIENMRFFKQAPFTFSKLHLLFERAEKLGEYRVRFHLKEPYGAFLHDAIWLQFYTPEYLAKHGWNGKPTCPNLAEPGLFGMGPYVLHKGYIEGDRSSPEVVLKANPIYWGEDKAKVETITIYTNLTLAQAREQVLQDEAVLDLTPVSFADQLDTVMSPYAKLAVSTSLNNYAMHINMINGDPALLDQRIRFAINHAIDQEYLLNLSMLGEGVMSPTMVSPNFYKVDGAIVSLAPFFAEYHQQNQTDIESLKRLVSDYQKEQGLDPNQPLQLTVVAQESFQFLIGDIQYFLSQINIALQVEVVSAEKIVFGRLFDTWQGKNKPWDLLLWGNYDWFKHPWSACFVYRPFNDWSTLPPNPYLDALSDQLLKFNVESDEYQSLLAEVIRHVYEQNYMVFLPTPNNVYAVNKEVKFDPGRSAFVYLRDLEVTDWHWSIRGDKPYPKTRMVPLQINRQNF